MDHYEEHVAASRGLLAQAHGRQRYPSLDQLAALAQVEALLAIAAAIRTHPSPDAAHHAAQAAGMVAAHLPRRPE
ncbi:hypothetical protein ACIQBJ_22325 [Kitasatospora sp. NPDC088391]|uniref:hypothetical protein n=1 Tax=Kitasatospora sp. NPDC088391 TaxID=3364074 RepID=UPI003818544B